MAKGLIGAALPNAQVASAGLKALVGKPADPMALELMEERGIDIADHQARQLDAEMCQTADLILVMDRDQRREVEQRYQFARGKVFRLGEFGDHDVLDPYRAGRNAFRYSLALIEEGAQQWAKRISRVSS